MKFLKVGSKVLVHVPSEEVRYHRAAAKYSGKEMEITKRVLMKQQSRVYYELKGAILNGIPLAFVVEWLIPIDERGN